ncbi:Sugar phosphate isomerase/epimerase [Sphingomonas carotinifaciens]|uniref:Sugar phosphate isomerase/epimerase n=2 Tax=Sphingomonas carotinifaciens TaxID=1166323 RepID=A0A1G7PQH7_9SPHN|nr:sugar phosphate isomerase/epimerase [Sphingomonas carotinifaciens]MWC45733.1 TIM barrel protein [Sphingomonas carotinifaciens]SDF88523.1 Sugar phosphate isomerase/epimerase [Sphingomonas carotinifaciens]
MHSDQFAMSLDLINRHYQEPNRNRYESKYFWEELYPLIGASGFRSIEIPYEPVWQFGGRSGVPMNRYCINTKYENTDNYRAALAKGDVDRVVGVTFDSNLFMRNANLDFYFGATGHFAGEALAHAADLNAEYFAISPSAYYGRIAHYHPDLEDRLGAFTERVVALVEGLAVKAKATSVALVLRNEYWSVFRGEHILALLDRLPAGVKLDVDTAHLTIAGIDPAAFITAHRDRIGCVHLTDTAFVDDAATWKTPNPEFPAHRATQVFRDPGTGEVDVPAIVSLLNQLGYAGPVVCSARQTRDPFRALLRTRALLNHLQN